MFAMIDNLYVPLSGATQEEYLRFLETDLASDYIQKEQIQIIMLQDKSEPISQQLTLYTNWTL